MIGDLVSVLRDVVNDHLNTSSGWSAVDAGPLAFLESERVDALDFKLNAVTLLLVNLEEEHAARPGDPRRRTLPDGTTLAVAPPIHLNAYVLFVARYKDYAQGLRYLSLIAQFFQSHPSFDHQSAPRLSDRIDHLTAELLSLSFADLNNLWSVLRSAYLPSLLYKVRMLVFQDEGLARPALAETAPSVGKMPDDSGGAP
jgi:hypothetical protein